MEADTTLEIQSCRESTIPKEKSADTIHDKTDYIGRPIYRSITNPQADTGRQYTLSSKQAVR